jgi:hypothetical protein
LEKKLAIAPLAMPRRLCKKTPEAETEYARASLRDAMMAPAVERNGNTQTKYWVFTVSGEPPKFEHPITFLMYQKEKGAQNGYEHYQGYVEFESKVRHKTAVTMLGFRWYTKAKPKLASEPTYYLNYRWGSQEANIRYCSSTWYCRRCSAGDAEGYPEFAKGCTEGCTKSVQKGKMEPTVVFGTPSTEFKTQEMHLHVRKRLMSGCPKAALYLEHPTYCAQFSKWIDRQHSVFAPQRNFQPLVYWLYGPSGTDKSRVASAVCTSTYFKAPDTKWFDGYDQQVVVVFNDFRKSTFTFSYLLDLLDRYPFHVEVKGAVVNMTAKCFIFTSSKSHEDLWREIAGHENENLYQLTRRITKEVMFPLEQSGKAELITEMRKAISVKMKESTKDELYGEWKPEDEVPEAGDLLPIG